MGEDLHLARRYGPSMRLLAIGDNCIDHYVDLGRRFPGGNALNVAVYSKQHHGAHADYVGVVGNDENGAYLLSQVAAAGLDTTYITVVEGATAVTEIRLEGGERVFAGYSEGVQAWARLPLDKVPPPSSYDVAHFTIWGWGREHIPNLREQVGVLSCDFSDQLKHPGTSIMEHLDYSFFSGSHLAGDEARRAALDLSKRTRGVVVVTLGARGSLAYDGERFTMGAAEPVEVVDTLGAGDAFIAAFLYGRERGDSLGEALARGHRWAARVCSRLGAWGG